jgi:hypothetical protein
MQDLDGARRSGVSVVCIAFVAAVGTAACKSSSSDSAAAAASATAAAAAITAAAAANGNALCSLVSPSEAASTLGLPSLQPPTSEGVPPVTVCKYSDGKYPGALTVRFETGRDLSQFAVIRKGHDENGQPTTDFPGLGDAAFKFSLSNINGVSMLGKQTVVLVQGHESHEKLAQLERLILQRL